MKHTRKMSANTVPVSTLIQSEIEELFELYSVYYENLNKEQFIIDLKNKTSVILMKNRKGEVKGFSTLTNFRLLNHPDKPYCLYSGDTIIHEDYWGTSALTMEFLKNILIEKIKHPFSNVWWFLISKGYKTYLLLANNFHEYYPRVGVKTPKEKMDIIECLSEMVYPNHFNRETGLITFEDSKHEKLKVFVAPITDQMCDKNIKIKFFQDANPNWERGDELACIGKVSFLLGITHPYRVFKKLVFKKLGKGTKSLAKNIT